MRVIATANQKGGSGKSSICASIAVASATSTPRDFRTVIFDADPQSSVMEWASLRDPEGDYLTVVRAPKGATCDDIREIAEKYEAEVCFIDTPGHHSPEIATLIKGCDGVIIPVKPRMFDQLSSSKTIKTLLETTSGDRILVVINETSPPRGIMEAPAVVETRKYYQTLYPDVTVAQTAIVKREIYDIAIRNGMSAIELEPGGQGAIDLRRLWIEVRNYFNIQPARGT